MNVWESYPYHPTSESILDLLRLRTQNTKSDLYFRVITSYFLAQMASSMRTVIKTEDRGTIPVNLYACALMTSGGGKNFSLNVLEHEVVGKFSEQFIKRTLPAIAEKSIEAEALRKANLNNSDFDEELEKLNKEYNALGSMPYSFSESSSPAYKQVRQKAQIAKCGSMNLIIDELGSNLTSSQEVLNVSLETFDIGLVKDKLTKASSDNIRYEQRTDPVPSNMLAFGTPARLFDGAKSESEFITLLETGYARRFLFGWGDKGTDKEYTAEELYDLLAASSKSNTTSTLADVFAKLADPVNIQKEILLQRTEGIALLEYKLWCEANAETLPEHEHIRKAEMQHRYFKALKLAGAYAFIDCTFNITLGQLYAAIKVVEDSALAFNKIITRPKAYVRLAKYIATIGTEVTQADLNEALTFYCGTNAVKQEMLLLAQAWGYTNNIVIKKKYVGGVEFLSGESLKENDLSEIILSYSNHEAFNYKNQVTAWDKIYKLTQFDGMHWLNHHVLDGHRKEENAQLGFNLVVIDCDGDVSLATAKLVLEDYTAMFYTTKRHTSTKNRFRIILPIKYDLKLSADDFKEFMDNIYEWLPFSLDAETNQRSRKWLSNSGQFVYTEGVLLDPLQFIPKTSKNEEHKKSMKSLGSLDHTKRWFASKWQQGNRNKLMFRYASMLQDSGIELQDIEADVLKFNKQLDDPMDEDRIINTIFKTLAQRQLEQ